MAATAQPAAVGGRGRRPRAGAPAARWCRRPAVHAHARPVSRVARTARDAARGGNRGRLRGRPRRLPRVPRARWLAPGVGPGERTPGARPRASPGPRLLLRGQSRRTVRGVGRRAPRSAGELARPLHAADGGPRHRCAHPHPPRPRRRGSRLRREPRRRVDPVGERGPHAPDLARVRREVRLHADRARRHGVCVRVRSRRRARRLREPRRHAQGLGRRVGGVPADDRGGAERLCGEPRRALRRRRNPRGHGGRLGPRDRRPGADRRAIRFPGGDRPRRRVVDLRREQRRARRPRDARDPGPAVRGGAWRVARTRPLGDLVRRRSRRKLPRLHQLRRHDQGLGPRRRRRRARARGRAQLPRERVRDQPGRVVLRVGRSGRQGVGCRFRCVAPAARGAPQPGHVHRRERRRAGGRDRLPGSHGAAVRCGVGSQPAHDAAPPRAGKRVRAGPGRHLAGLGVRRRVHRRGPADVDPSVHRRVERGRDPPHPRALPQGLRMRADAGRHARGHGEPGPHDQGLGRAHGRVRADDAGRKRDPGARPVTRRAARGHRRRRGQGVGHRARRARSGPGSPLPRRRRLRRVPGRSVRRFHGARPRSGALGPRHRRDGCRSAAAGRGALRRAAPVDPPGRVRRRGRQRLHRGPGRRRVRPRSWSLPRPPAPDGGCDARGAGPRRAWTASRRAGIWPAPSAPCDCAPARSWPRRSGRGREGCSSAAGGRRPAERSSGGSPRPASSRSS